MWTKRIKAIVWWSHIWTSYLFNARIAYFYLLEICLHSSQGFVECLRSNNYHLLYHPFKCSPHAMYTGAKSIRQHPINMCNFHAFMYQLKLNKNSKEKLPTNSNISKADFMKFGPLDLIFFKPLSIHHEPWIVWTTKINLL